MKFFSDFGSCCRAPTLPEPPELTTTLAPLTCAAGSGHAHRSRRNRLTGSRVDCSTQWKPALSVISEDSSVSTGEKKYVRATLTEKKPPAKVRSWERVREPSHGDEYRKSPIPMVIPAFLPTPFMF